MITCREIVDAEAEANSYDKEKKLLQQILIKKSICRKENIYVLLAFLLITIQLLISDSSYCYIIKYQAKKKHLLPFHMTNNELNKKWRIKIKLKIYKTKNSDDHDEKYMKIKFNFDDELSLNKMIEIHSMVMAVRAVFHENNKYYLKVFLDVCLYKL